MRSLRLIFNLKERDIKKKILITLRFFNLIIIIIKIFKINYSYISC